MPYHCYSLFHLKFYLYLSFCFYFIFCLPLVHICVVPFERFSSRSCCFWSCIVIIGMVVSVNVSLLVPFAPFPLSFIAHCRFTYPSRIAPSYLLASLMLFRLHILKEQWTHPTVLGHFWVGFFPLLRNFTSLFSFEEGIIAQFCEEFLTRASWK